MGHIGKGLKWVQNNKQSAKEIVIKGQNYVDKKYSKEKNYQVVEKSNL